MTQGERDNSGGELTSFLHLTGLRPLALLLVAGLAGGVGVFLALGEPATFQARYVLNVDRVADNDLAIGELDLVAEEIVSTASFPEVQAAVEEQTGLVFEDDYVININRAGGALININVVADQPTDAQDVAIETGIAAVTFTTERQAAGIVSSRDQLDSELAELRTQLAELTTSAGGVNPIVALANAEAALLQRRADILNPPTISQIQADGTILEVTIPYTGPSAEELQATVDELSPIEREFQSLQTSEAALTTTLSTRNNSIRELDSAIQLIESERETSLVINEVVTEETSRITGLLTGLLLFAVPAALLVIAIFTIYDLLTKKDEPVEEPAEEPQVDPAGAIAPPVQRALPPSSVRRSLTVVDEDYNRFAGYNEGDILAEDDYEDDDVIDVVVVEDYEDDYEEDVAELDTEEDEDDEFENELADEEVAELDDFDDIELEDELVGEDQDQEVAELDTEDTGENEDELEDDVTELDTEASGENEDEVEEVAELDTDETDQTDELEEVAELDTDDTDQTDENEDELEDEPNEEDGDDEPPATKNTTSKDRAKARSKAKAQARSRANSNSNSKRRRDKDGRWGRSQNSKAG